MIEEKRKLENGVSMSYEKLCEIIKLVMEDIPEKKKENKDLIWSEERENKLRIKEVCRDRRVAKRKF